MTPRGYFMATGVSTLDGKEVEVEYNCHVFTGMGPDRIEHVEEIISINGISLRHFQIKSLIDVNKNIQEADFQTLIKESGILEK